MRSRTWIRHKEVVDAVHIKRRTGDLSQKIQVTPTDEQHGRGRTMDSLRIMEAECEYGTEGGAGCAGQVEEDPGTSSWLSLLLV